MKALIRSFIVETIVLYLVAQVTVGLNFSNGLNGILIAGIALTLASFLVKPIVNILLLPINLVTFGLFKWLANAVTLYLVDLVVSDFWITNFSFAGSTNEWFTIPAFQTPNVLVAYIVFSFIIFFTSSIIYWFIK